MSKLLFLSKEDFKVQQGPNGPIMCSRVKGFSLILFYSRSCVHCHSFIPIFKKIPAALNGCQFGMVNVSNNLELIKLAETTISKISFVPFILLYINGKPFIQYKGPRTKEGVTKFIVEVSSKINNKQYFSSIQKKQKEDKKNRDKTVPYSMYRPCGEAGGVCYLTYDKAYK